MTPDPIFADPRLAAVYDAFDGERDDLDAYVALAAELGATSVLDVGCGTGSLALRLAALDLQVVGADPAVASLDLARSKPGADRVRWLAAGAADTLPGVQVDLAVMAGNVAQVFTDDDEWRAVLQAMHEVVRPGGHLVFETRRPERRAWEDWAHERREPEVREVPGVGRVEQRFELGAVDLPLVLFRWSYLLPGPPPVSWVCSDSTLVFRDVAEIRRELDRAGFAVVDVRDAPDRPGQELVLVCRRQAASAA